MATISPIIKGGAPVHVGWSEKDQAWEVREPGLEDPIFSSVDMEAALNRARLRAQRLEKELVAHDENGGVTLREPYEPNPFPIKN